MMSYIYKGISILIAMVLHEWCHGFVSYKLGDPTPKDDGRLSLNPLKHIDPFGALMLLVCGFGWAKPVQINSYHYKNTKVGVALTALAGPMMNLFIAIVGIILGKHIFIGSEFFSILTIINLSLMIFNLIPIPPLDGSKIVAMLLPYDLYEKYMRIEQYGFFILIAISMSGALSGFLSRALYGIYSLLYTIL